MLKVEGHLGSQSLPGDESLVIPTTPTGFVGGMPLKRGDSGLELCTSYNTAYPNCEGLARYSEATFIKDCNGYTDDAKCSFVRDALGVKIGLGKDPQTGLEDAKCPYDTAQTYAVGDLLYVKETEGILTNQSADGGSGAKALGKVMEAPDDPSAGDLMKIQIFSDLV